MHANRTDGTEDAGAGVVTPPEPLLVAGAIGPVVFVTVFLALGATRPGYDPFRLQVSYLSLGDGGWIQVLSFLATGALILAFALGVQRALSDGGGSVAAAVAIAAAGAGLVLAGVFTTMPAFGYPPGTPDGFPPDIAPTAYLHVVGAFLFFGGTIAASLVMARVFRRAGERGWAFVSLAAGVVVLVFFGASSADPSGRPFLPAIAGLLQRVAIVTGLGWMAGLAARLARR